MNYPKFLNTKEDYEFARKNFDRNFWIDDFEKLYGEAHRYTYKGRLSEDETNIEFVKSDEEKFLKKPLPMTEWVEQKKLFDGITYEIFKHKEIKYVFVIELKPDSKLAKIGYTSKEVENIIMGFEPDFDIDKHIEKLQSDYDKFIEGSDTSVY